MSAPPNLAVENGHDLVWDPPATSSAERWTCQRIVCGDAAIRYGANEYGTATERRCPGLRPEARDLIVIERERRS